MPRKRSTKKVPKWSTHEGNPGLVHIYTGNGKGKTTSAVGLVVRAHGQGLRCCFIQFMKGKFPYGEVKVLRKLKGVTVKQFGTLEFVRKGGQKRVDRAEAKAALEYATKAMASGRYDLVVMDEVCVAEFMELVKVKDIIDAVKGRAEKVEVVMTGRKAKGSLIRLADYVTEFKKTKHPFDKGVLGRKGIEY